MDKITRIKELLLTVYGDEKTQNIMKEVELLINEYSEKIAARKENSGFGKDLTEKLTQKDVILITYGDNILGDENNSALRNLKLFSDKYLNDIITSIHLLPFFPYSSDDGFSVIDYLEVDEKLGDWDDIDNLTENFRLMFDYVANHMSSKSTWFTEFLKGSPKYEDYFIEINEEIDISTITRPRATTLLSPYSKQGEDVRIWTTFSPDQVDVNYANPKVFITMTKILLEYYNKGASLIRLDAILYMWKQLGTTCAHLPQTHALIQAWRLVTELVFKEAVILAEVSAPHVENITYLGDGTNECHMIYQFPLAPLVLYSFLKNDASVLTNWAKSMDFSHEQASFFNLLACHDGIGLQPARGILQEEEISWLVEQSEERGGKITYKSLGDGSKLPYELNIVYRDAIKDLSADEQTNIERYLCAYSIILVVKGVPGIYIHSLLGSENAYDEREKTGRNRSVNRKKFELKQIENELNKNINNRKTIFEKFKHMIETRQKYDVFDPFNSPMEVLDLGNSVFAVLRKSADGSKAFVALHNVSPHAVEAKISSDMIDQINKDTVLTDVLTNNNVEQNKDGAIQLNAYEYKWLMLN